MSLARSRPIAYPKKRAGSSITVKDAQKESKKSSASCAASQRSTCAQDKKTKCNQGNQNLKMAGIDSAGSQIDLLKMAFHVESPFENLNG
jgi:hypothetical protein